jgi:hypothetical protein
MSAANEMDPRTVEAERSDAYRSHGADRPPSQDEEGAAEEGAASVDEPEVAKHEKEMDSLGADVKGEGEIR